MDDLLAPEEEIETLERQMALEHSLQLERDLEAELARGQPIRNVLLQFLNNELVNIEAELGQTQPFANRLGASQALSFIEAFNGSFAIPLKRHLKQTFAQLFANQQIARWRDPLIPTRTFEFQLVAEEPVSVLSRFQLGTPAIPIPPIQPEFVLSYFEAFNDPDKFRMLLEINNLRRRLLELPVTSPQARLIKERIIKLENRLEVLESMGTQPLPAPPILSALQSGTLRTTRAKKTRKKKSPKKKLKKRS